MIPRSMRQAPYHPSSNAQSSKRAVSRIAIVVSFLFGCIISASTCLFLILHYEKHNPQINTLSAPISANDHDTITHQQQEQRELSNPNQPTSQGSSLQGLRIIIVIAAFDFGQLPHLEEVLDAYQDLCVTGASKVDILIHATVAYPVALIDLLNSRLLPSCQDIFSLKIVLKPPSLRLHLVDCHREVFYQKIDDYDLFIYTEDDIRVTPTNVAAYWEETNRLRATLGDKRSSDFNVGIVRYEYNFPSNVVIDDKTRHATQNVTRVYWEHSKNALDPFPTAVDAVPQSELHKTHVHMDNHHQGMFLATSFLLKAWKDRKGCEFDKVRNRPGFKNRPSQPSEGTQRVWMSSQMLYGKRHCKVQQVIPMDSFGTLTVLHLPNKNYRRVGHYRNRTFSDGTEVFDQAAKGKLLTAMKLHLDMRKKYPKAPVLPYKGIIMENDIPAQQGTPLLNNRMAWYRNYVDRGGVLIDTDWNDLDLAER